jgi:hypothetical protein
MSRTFGFIDIKKLKLAFPTVAMDLQQSKATELVRRAIAEISPIVAAQLRKILPCGVWRRR